MISDSIGINMQQIYSPDPLLQYYESQISRLKAQVTSLHNELSLRGVQSTSSKTISLPYLTGQQGLRHIPFVYEVTSINKSDVEANEDLFFYIQDDAHRGLKSPGRNGYIKNDGPGVLTYRIADETERWSFPATLKPGESDKYQFSDNIHVVALVIRADTAETMFRMRWTSGLQEGDENGRT